MPTFSLAGLWSTMGPVSQAVVAALLIMSLVSLYIAAERWFTFFRMAKQSHQFAVIVADLLQEQRFADAIDRASERGYQYSYLARLISMGLREFEGLRARSTRFDPVDLIQRALDRAMYAEALGMRKGLALLATIASTAPFVGLFGTLAGIIRAFRSMAYSETAGIAPVYGGMADALVTTALGVLVSIPAIWAFNYLLDRVEGFEIQMNNSAAEIIDYCIKQIGVTRGQTNTNTKI